MLDSLILYLDLHIGVSRSREHRIINRRVKGVWDDRLERQYLRLSDGRILTYFLDGPRSLEGPPLVTTADLPHIFVFHAMFLTANSFLMTDPPKDYVLVGVNRPGYFGSDAPDTDQSYTLETFATDIQELADHLHLDTFLVAGHSSGGPCALACAAYMPHRVKGVAILSGDPEYAHEGVPDKKPVNRCCIGCCLPFLLDRVFCCLQIAQGARDGLRNDYRLDTSPYPFRTELLQQSVHVFVGQDDQVLPLEVSRHVHQRLSNSTLHVVPNVGHLGLLRDEVLKEVFQTLLKEHKKDKDVELPILLSVPPMV